MSKLVGRLALRHEGIFWNAYYAMPDTMEDAIPIGSIIYAAVAKDPDRKRLFMAMMQGLVSEIIGEAEIQECVIQEAPEHERSGHA